MLKDWAGSSSATATTMSVWPNTRERVTHCSHCSPEKQHLHHNHPVNTVNHLNIHNLVLNTSSDLFWTERRKKEGLRSVSFLCVPNVVLFKFLQIVFIF